MTALRIPTTEQPFYTQSVDLEGREFTFVFRYSEREDRWYLSVQDAEGAAIANSVKLVTNWPLLYRKSFDPRAPLGVLMVMGDSPPGLNDLVEGGRCELLYITSDDPIAPGLRAFGRVV